MEVTVRVFATEEERNANNLAESKIVGVASTTEEFDRLINNWHSDACKTGSLFHFFAYYDQNDNRIDSYNKAFTSLGGNPIEIYDHDPE
ncbi:MAG TPA: hypothetical protein VJ399_01945 [Patescibacteria group bacterium]|nr:hypothetical protein [Patescibacteria group bacterium]